MFPNINYQTPIHSAGEVSTNDYDDMSLDIFNVIASTLSLVLESS